MDGRRRRQIGGEGVRPHRSQGPDPVTDLTSRIVAAGANRGSFDPAHECPARVDEEAQTLVAARVIQPPDGKGRMVPTDCASFRTTGGMSRDLGAEAGYFRDDAFHVAAERGIDVNGPPDNGGTMERGIDPRKPSHR